MQMFVELLSSGWLFLLCFIAFTAYFGFARPPWFGKLLEVLGSKSGFDEPFYYFKRWTWKEAPENWRSKMMQCILWMVVFGALAFFFVYSTPGQKQWPIIAVPAMMSIHFLFYALRIYLSVKRLNSR
jgi:hypothetical protein